MGMTVPKRVLAPRHTKGGWVRPESLPRGPNGLAQCRQCSKEVHPPRRTFCSQACVDLWVVRTGSGMARFIRKRDKGVCALCRLDCQALKRQYKKLLTKQARVAFKVQHGIPASRTIRFWDVDHIVPVVEGGGSSGPDNLRTLCIPCHRRVTRELSQKRARARKEAL